jgi:hypothetical protein
MAIRPCANLGGHAPAAGLGTCSAHSVPHRQWALGTGHWALGTEWRGRGRALCEPGVGTAGGTQCSGSSGCSRRSLQRCTCHIWDGVTLRCNGTLANSKSVSEASQPRTRPTELSC